MRSIGECCHYDEGYDDGFEDATNGPTLSDAALYLRALSRQRALAGDEKAAAALDLAADEMMRNDETFEEVVKCEREREQELLAEYKRAVVA